jgi:hypothetical protein
MYHIFVIECEFGINIIRFHFFIIEKTIKVIITIVILCNSNPIIKLMAV